jgi:site-specific DNA-methyltransferase (adenine-specific)
VLDKNTIHLGDCLEIMPHIEDKSVDMILCDLPYGTTACKWDVIIPFEPLWEQYKRIIKDNGAIVLFGSQPFTSMLVMSNLKMFKYEWTWKKSRKTGHFLAKKQPLKKHENILLFSKKSVLYNPQGITSCDIIKKNTEGRLKSNLYGNLKNKKDHNQIITNYPDTILEFNNEHNINAHPTQKPVALLEYLIKTYTQENELVLDNCAGSGSTGIACINTNRNYIMIEKEQEYYDIIQKRIKEHIEKDKQLGLEL